MVKKRPKKQFKYFPDQKNKNQTNAPPVVNDVEEEEIFCIVCAHTGKAAFNIRGDTFTRVFCLNPMTAEKGASLEPQGNTKIKLKKRFQNCAAIIIDEVSMISNKQLYDSNKIVQTVLNKNDLFFI